jgi:Recombinase
VKEKEHKNYRSIQRKKKPNQHPANNEFPKDENGVIYVRQSKIVQMQKNIHSFEMQTGKFLEYFRNKGCTGYIEIVADDEGMSGTKDIHEMPGLTRVMRLIDGRELLRGKKIGWAAAVHVNRFTRDKWLVKPGTIMKACYDNDVWIATLRMDFNFKDEYCQRVFMIEAEESARHLEWMKLVLGGGLRAASDRGYYDSRFLSPGYIVDRSDPLKKKYIVYRPHAEVVYWLFKRYFELDGNFPALRREVDSMPYLFPKFESWVDSKNIGKFLVKEIEDGPHQGNYKPSERGLRSILTNPVYIGWWIPIEGGVIENNHEPIVDEWLFTYAHKRLSTHDLNGERQKPALVRNGDTEALLKKVTVGENGHRVYAKTDRKCGYYVACTYGTLSQEYEVSVSVKWLDEVFLEKFLERVVSIDPAKFSDWEDAIEQKQATREERKKLIRRQVNDARRQRRETMDILDDPEVPKTKQMKIDYANKVAGLEAKIAEWEQQLEAPNDEDDEEVIYEISTLIPRIGDVWPRLPFDKKLRFVGALVNRASLRSVAPNWLELRIEWKMEGWETDIAYIQALKGTGKKWTKEEEKLLGELYLLGEAEELLEAFPDRSWQGIYNHANKLGMHRISSGRGPGGTRLDNRIALNDAKFMEEHAIASDKKVHWLRPWSG